MEFLDDIRFSINIFPFVWILGLIPISIILYRRHGTLNPWRLIVLSSFIFYIITAYILVIMPLPSIKYVEQMIAQNLPIINLNPFQIFISFFKENPIFHGGGIKQALTDGSFLQPIFNIFLTLPFGFYMRYYFKRSWQITLIWSIVLTSFFEFTQLSALYGIYPRPYRLFDVDDLILNTLGSMIGFWLAPVLSRILPNWDKIDQKNNQLSLTASVWRRIIAGIVDLLIIYIFGLIGAALTPFNILWYFISVIVFMFIVPTVMQQQTLGMRLLRLKYETDDGRSIKISQLLLRFTTGQLAIGLVFFQLIIFSFRLYFRIDETSFNQSLIIFVVGILAVAAIAIFVDFIWSVIRPNHLLWFDRISKTYIRPIIK